MLKKIVLNIIVFIVTIPVLANASSNTAARIGNKYYDTLSEAILNAGSKDIIKLVSNVELDSSLTINKTINIDLNGNTITAPTVAFLVSGGTLKVEGKGVIKETKPNYGAIKVIGSKEPTDSKYSIVSIGKDVVLEGWSGIFITHDSSKSYGVNVYLEGTIKAVSDTSGGTGIGIYVNGNIKHQDGHPIVNILDGAKIISNGNGLYIAGYSEFLIKKAYISGYESGIGIKSGILNIDGATIISEGPDKTPTEGYNNGLKASGTAVQIESNDGYLGKMEIDISNGKFTSKNSNVIYEYIGKGNNSLVKSMSISGGTFISESNKNVFNLSNSFTDIHSGFISGGKYSSNPSSYLKKGYSQTLENGLYKVTENTSKTVFGETKSTDTNWIIILVIIPIIILITLYILKKQK